MSKEHVTLQVYNQGRGVTFPFLGEEIIEAIELKVAKESKYLNKLNDEHDKLVTKLLQINNERVTELRKAKQRHVDEICKYNRTPWFKKLFISNPLNKNYRSTFKGSDLNDKIRSLERKIELTSTKENTVANKIRTLRKKQAFFEEGVTYHLDYNEMVEFGIPEYAQICVE